MLLRSPVVLSARDLLRRDNLKEQSISCALFLLQVMTKPFSFSTKQDLHQSFYLDLVSVLSEYVGHYQP